MNGGEWHFSQRSFTIAFSSRAYKTTCFAQVGSVRLMEAKATETCEKVRQIWACICTWWCIVSLDWRKLPTIQKVFFLWFLSILLLVFKFIMLKLVLWSALSSDVSFRELFHVCCFFCHSWVFFIPSSNFPEFFIDAPEVSIHSLSQREDVFAHL